MVAVKSVIAKSFGTPDRTDLFLDHSHRDVVTLASVTVGRGIYQPGWKWSTHAGGAAGLQAQHHVGYVVSGCMVVRGPDGLEVSVGPGEAFEVLPGHDAWVSGAEPCVALDFAAR